jgi:protease-4
VGAALRLLGNLLRVVFAPLWWLGHRLRRPKASWVELRLGPQIVALQPPAGRLARLAAAWRGPQPSSLEAIERLVDALVDDPRVDGLLLVMGALHSGWASLEGVREQLLRLRAAGKQVLAYLPHGGGHRELFVALAADRIAASPRARLSLPGVAAEAFYIQPLLERLGVHVEVLAQGQYKTAAERATRDSMSEPQREQVSALLRAVHEALDAALSARPGLDGAARAALLQRGPLSAAEAQAAGILDAVCYEDELAALLWPGRTPAPTPVRAAPYLAWRRARLWKAVRTEPYIAVVPVHGMIGGRGADPRSDMEQRLTAALRGVATDRRAAGVVLHIDSPGGSALVSDLLHREVIRLAADKPVVACFGEVAASGGYYLAAGAHRIVGRPLAVTGSIGVILVKPEIAALLERVGVRSQVVKLGPHADMMSIARPLDAAERSLLERDAHDFYTAFLQVVADGRQRPVAEIEPLAGGRVWSGRDAHARGLVDVLGGMPQALEQVRAALTDWSEPARRRLRARTVRVELPGGQMPPPRPAHPTSELGELLSSFGAEPEALYLASSWIELR